MVWKYCYGFPISFCVLVLQRSLLPTSGISPHHLPHPQSSSHSLHLYLPLPNPPLSTCFYSAYPFHVLRHHLPPPPPDLPKFNRPVILPRPPLHSLTPSPHPHISPSPPSPLHPRSLLSPLIPPQPSHSSLVFTTASTCPQMIFRPGVVGWSSGGFCVVGQGSCEFS